MFPKLGTTSSSTFDLTLMISLIRHLTPIPVGDILPLTTDISEGADLSRLKYYRNKISHSDTGTLSETDFHQWWTDISEAIQRLSKDRFKQTCNDLKYAKLDQNDKEIPIEIRNIARTNDSITKGVQKLHEMQIQEWESEKIVETRAIKELIHLMTYNNIVLVIVNWFPCCLQKDINYNLTNWNGDTPLYTASYKGYTNIVKLLLENNANPNISTWICEKPQNNVKLKYQHDFDDNSKRHHSDRGEVESPSWATLRKRKCSLDGLFDGSVFQIPHHVIRRYQVTSLYIASRRATSILGDPNRTSCDASKTTPLYEASSEGHTDIVKLLLNHNADHNRRCTWKEDTAMDRAVCNNRIGVVEELLKHKVDCTISNRETKIPLFVAVENNYKEIIDLMLNLSSDVHIRDKFNTMRLYLASKSGDLRTVQELLNQNVDPGNEYNISSLYIASYEGHVDIVNLLLDKNIDTNIVNKENESVLYVAVSRGHTDIVKKLLEHDCNPNICNTDNETPLHIATRLGHTEIVKLLLIHKGDLNVYNNEHQTPLIIAATIGRVEITNLLLEYNCDVNISNNENETPLYIASCRGDMAIAKLLLNYNCDPLISNKYNESPLVKAKHYGHLEIAEMLSEKLNINNVFYKT
ncbi:ANK [Mytilus edulis]|uniref:ANK n=1 Tax=Mytilus edulis TaxID=6550 RepID=A0A8S3RG62_MYTED|nr:ANK [Mytilus edulis]